MSIGAPWYVGNNLKIPFVQETLNNTYLTITFQPNLLIRDLPPDRQHRRLTRKHHTDIPKQL